jgi:ABC-type sugar transport system ATPase subunit
VVGDRADHLILNDPTRGVDIGAKSEIYALCDRLAQGGMALLFTSSEIEETLGVSDRVLVFYKGRIIREFARGEASKADVMHWVAGGVIPEVRKVEVAQEAALRLPLA